jgi:hypothetical protein
MAQNKDGFKIFLRPDCTFFVMSQINPIQPRLISCALQLGAGQISKNNVKFYQTKRRHITVKEPILFRRFCKKIAKKRLLAYLCLYVCLSFRLRGKIL